MKELFKAIYVATVAIGFLVVVGFWFGVGLFIGVDVSSSF